MCAVCVPVYSRGVSIKSCEFWGMWCPALRVAKPSGLCSHVVAACEDVLGCGLSFCMYFFMVAEGRGSPGVPFRLCPEGCSEGRVGFVVCVSSPHRASDRCAWMMLCFGAGGRHRGSPRTHFVERWGPSPVFPFRCLAFYVLYYHCFYPRGRGLYLRLLLCDVYVSV